MIPEIISTKIEKSEIAFAGVDSGLKMFSRPVERESATAVTTKQNTDATADKAVRTVECLTRRIWVPQSGLALLGSSATSEAKQLHYGPPGG
jgi:hypothetical protein